MVGLGPAAGDLGMGQALPCAHMNLAQPVIEDWRGTKLRAQNVCSLHSACEGAGIEREGLCARLHRSHDLRLCRRLRAACGVQFRVQPALQPPFAVPIGLAVAQEVDGKIKAHGRGSKAFGRQLQDQAGGLRLARGAVFVDIAVRLRGLGKMQPTFSGKYTAARGQGLRDFDLYLPQSAPRALVVYAHGGGFSHGKHTGPFPQACAARLVAERIGFASISYAKGGAPMERFDEKEQATVTHAQLRTARVGMRINPAYCGPLFYAALEDFSQALRALRDLRDPFDLSGVPMLSFGASAGGIIAASLAYPPRDWPDLEPVDGAFCLCGAMVQPWRLSKNGPPLTLMHSFHDGVISPRNTTLIANKAEAKSAPLRAIVTNVKGHKHQLDALLEGRDDRGQPYWDALSECIEAAIERSAAR